MTAHTPTCRHDAPLENGKCPICMEPKTTYTPTPWEFYEGLDYYAIYDSEGNEVVLIASKTNRMRVALERIVRAVNNHGALLEAARKSALALDVCLSRIARKETFIGDDEFGRWEFALMDLQKAIAQVEGRGS